MESLIEPNVHPILVHFVVGLLISATGVLVLAAVIPPGSGMKPSLITAGDWMLSLGLVSLVLAIAAGFQAYFTVAHDTPSHEAMTTHRNWALATAAAFLVIGAWRLPSRGRSPSVLFAIGLIVAAGLLTTTAWWGGRLVFHHGLGVMSLPQTESEEPDYQNGGHDH